MSFDIERLDIPTDVRGECVAGACPRCMSMTLADALVDLGDCLSSVAGKARCIPDGWRLQEEAFHAILDARKLLQRAASMEMVRGENHAKQD